MRKIKILDTRGNNNDEPVISGASTLGELKQEGKLDLENVSLMAKSDEGRTNLSSNSDSLPEGDFTLIITAKNIKSGICK